MLSSRPRLDSPVPIQKMGLPTAVNAICTVPMNLPRGSPPGWFSVNQGTQPTTVLVGHFYHSTSMVTDSFQFPLLPSEPVLRIPCFTVSLSVQVSVCQCILLMAACVSPCGIVLQPVSLHSWNSCLSFSIRWGFLLPGVIDGFYLNLAILDLMYAIVLVIISNQFPLLPLTLTRQRRSIFHLVARWRWKPGFPWLSAYTQQGRGSS